MKGYSGHERACFAFHARRTVRPEGRYKLITGKQLSRLGKNSDQIDQMDMQPYSYQ